MNTSPTSTAADTVAERPDSRSVRDLFDRHLVAVGREHGIAVFTANNQKANGDPSCRCCIDIGDARNVLVLAGGIDIESTEQWVLHGGNASWAGIQSKIEAMLTAAGVRFEAPETAAKTFTIIPDDETVADAEDWVRVHTCRKCDALTDREVCDDCISCCDRCGTEVADGEWLCDLCETIDDDDEDDDDF